MKTCNLCGKRIKDVKLLINGTLYDVNVCATCLRPYTAEGEHREIVKVIYKKITAKKKK
jgi:ribosomal protein L28